MEQADAVNSRSILSLTKKERAVVRISRIRDTFFETCIVLLTILSAVMVLLIFTFILYKSWKIFQVNKLGFVTNTGFDRQLIDAYNAPADRPLWVFGAFGLLAGTITTTLGALLIAVPAAIGTAIVITELSPMWMKVFLKSVIRLLASIPSIIYGLVGLMVVVPFISDYLIKPEWQERYIRDFLQLTGNSMLAGIIVLSIMIMPLITALSVDAINAVPHRYKEASLALGLSHWRTIVRVIVPAAKSGIMAGVILGTGRALGEAIALSMVSGGTGNIPNPANGLVFFFTPVLTLASAIVNKAEAMATPSIEAALFACGVILLLTTAFLSLATRVVEKVVKRREGIE